MEYPQNKVPVPHFFIFTGKRKATVTFPRRQQKRLKNMLVVKHQAKTILEYFL